MSKSKKNVNEKKPFLAILPVAIGLILIFGISLGVWAFSGPKANPQISNPNDPFLKLGDWVVTNENSITAFAKLTVTMKSYASSIRNC